MIEAYKNYWLAMWEFAKATWWISVIMIVAFVCFVAWNLRKGR